MADIHSAATDVYAQPSNFFGLQVASGMHPAPARRTLHSVPRGPLLPGRLIPVPLLRPHVPVPKPLPSFAIYTFAGQSLQLGPSAAGLWHLPDVICREPFLGCLDPYPGSLSGAFTRFFPLSFGLPATVKRSAVPQVSGLRLLSGPLFRGCSHSLMFRPPSLLATRVVPTAAPWSLRGSCDFYFRAPCVSLPSRTSDMLAV
jgi:hypothetical protein